MSKTFLFVLAYLCLSIGFSNQNEQESDWELKKVKDEISIFTRKVNYSNYEEFKSEMVVESAPEVIIRYLKNIDDYKEWLPDCLESKRLDSISDSEQVNYILTAVPWPYEDRGFAYKFSIVPLDPNSRQLKVLIDNRPEYIPKRKHIVRIPKSKGFWILTSLNENQTKVIYQMHVEPGGYVPAWLYNWKIVDTPYTFMYNLRIQFEKE